VKLFGWGGTRLTPLSTVVAVFSLLVVAGCTSPAVTSAGPSVEIAERPLPHQAPFFVPPGAVVACAGVGLQAVLRGNPNDPRVAWLINPDGSRFDVVWPAGYRARFAPRLEVLDAAGNVVIRDGDPVSGGCVTDQPRVLLLEPPFK
jgi:hypothetical protein